MNALRVTTQVELMEPHALRAHVRVVVKINIMVARQPMYYAMIAQMSINYASIVQAILI